MKLLNEIGLLKVLLLNNIPFAVYRLPWRTEVHHVISFNLPKPYYKLNEIEGLSGFVMHPFQSSSEFPVYLFPPDRYFMSNELTPEMMEELRDINFNHIADKPLQAATSQKQYYTQFKQAENLFDQGKLDKIVLSRIIHHRKIDSESATHIFLKLYHAYPSSYIFMVNLPGQGIWMGASPEILLNKVQGWFQTVSLAGTKPFTGVEPPVWTAKEFKEQKIVTDFIKQNLQEAGILHAEIVGPETIRAANLWHLQTMFRIHSSAVHISTSDLIRRLHPTPAVSGFPKDVAVSEIPQIELHKREYYTGFLGAWNLNEQYHLYVNLRSMRLNSNGANLFVGGGITPDSDMHDEWEETENKSKTLLSLLDTNRR